MRHIITDFGKRNKKTRLKYPKHVSLTTLKLAYTFKYLKQEK